jgi:hypothetical protein
MQYLSKLKKERQEKGGEIEIGEIEIWDSLNLPQFNGHFGNGATCSSQIIQHCFERIK